MTLSRPHAPWQALKGRRGQQLCSDTQSAERAISSSIDQTLTSASRPAVTTLCASSWTASAFTPSLCDCSRGCLIKKETLAGRCVAMRPCGQRAKNFDSMRSLGSAGAALLLLVGCIRAALDRWVTPRGARSGLHPAAAAPEPRLGCSLSTFFQSATLEDDARHPASLYDPRKRGDFVTVAALPLVAPLAPPRYIV